jgi:hypothetical protein
MISGHNFTKTTLQIEFTCFASDHKKYNNKRKFFDKASKHRVLAAGIHLLVLFSFLNEE